MYGPSSPPFRILRPHMSIAVVMTSRIWRWSDGVKRFTPAVRHIPVKRMVRFQKLTRNLFRPWYVIDTYMSYRWRESFNTVRSPSDSWRHHNGDWHVWAQNAERRGGWTIHPSWRWLISCARTAVLYVCLSIALTSCTTSMAETNLDAIKKQKNAEYSKRYRLKRKMKIQQQAPTTSEAEPEKLQV